MQDAAPMQVFAGTQEATQLWKPALGPLRPVRSSKIVV